MYYNTHTPQEQRERARSALEQAITFGQIQRLQYALDHGVDPNLTRSIKKNVSMSVKHDFNNYSLLHWVMYYFTDIRDGSVPDGSIEFSDQTYKYSECARLLLEHKANINAVCSTNRSQGTEEDCPLTQALANKSKKAVSLLLEYKPDLTLVLNNRSPLLMAIEVGVQENIQALLKAGADPNQTWPGQIKTPLDLAVAREEIAVATMLLEYGAKVDALIGPIKDNNIEIMAMTPLHLAQKNNNQEMEQLLLQHHADPQVPMKYKVDGEEHSSSVKEYLTIIQAHKPRA